MIQELKFDEIQMVGGAGELSDVIDSVANGAQKVMDTAYRTGYRLGAAIRSILT